MMMISTLNLLRCRESESRQFKMKGSWPYTGMMIDTSGSRRLIVISVFMAASSSMASAK